MHKKSFILLLGAAFIWGTTFPILNYVLQHNSEKISPTIFLFIRNLIAATVGIVIIKFMRISSRNFLFNKKMIFLGILNGIAFLLQYQGMSLGVLSGESALLVNLNIIIVALLEPIIDKSRKFGKKILLGVLIGFIGASIVSIQDKLELILTEGLTSINGSILLILAAIIWSFWIIFSKPNDEIHTNMHPLIIATAIALWTAITIIPFFLFNIYTSSYKLNISIISDFPIILSIFWLGAVCSLIAYVFWAEAIINISSTIADIIIQFQFVVAIILGYFFLNENITSYTLLGATLIIVSIIIVVISIEKKGKEEKSIIST